LRKRNIDSINKIISDFLVEILYNFNLTIEPDLFMETLLNNFKNDVTSYQFFIFKFKRQERKTLLEKLNILKLDNRTEEADIIECQLTRLSELEIRNKLESSNLFVHLNNEKMSPHFLNLAKININEGSLKQICNDTGTKFVDDASRREFILSFYTKLYSGEGQVSNIGDIESFLGPDILNNPIVVNSKLSEQLRVEMDANLSLEELDASISSAKTNSAGGMDGINNRTLKMFWKYFRIPVFNYAERINTTGKLTQSFDSASIKLIPKKGDLTKLGNWRPISLLNCIYKVISRAVNARLQKVAPIMLSRAQKGFVKNKYIQECLINVIERIAHCNEYRIPGLVVAIDQARAFDTVSHEYMSKVYNFFGFGENFKKLMNTIGTNRKACLIWEDGSFSCKFDLKLGRTQGDGPSPLQYNMAEQILLFKIELDPNLRPMLELAFDSSIIPTPCHGLEKKMPKRQIKLRP
jgi:Reverse transcriptase (RNA-dependent DNA polymerase)